MEICNVCQIFDNGRFVSIITNSGSVVHLPEGQHSICVKSDKVIVDMFENEGDETHLGKK